MARTTRVGLSYDEENRFPQRRKGAKKSATISKAQHLCAFAGTLSSVSLI